MLRRLPDIELRAAVPVKIVGGSHVFFLGGISEPYRAGVCGDTRSPDIYADKGPGIDDLRLLPDMLVGNRVVMFITPKVDAVVLVYSQPGVIFYFKRILGKFF